MLFTNNNETILPRDGFEYERYHVSNHLYKTLLRPAGPLRLAGRFTILAVSPHVRVGKYMKYRLSEQHQSAKQAWRLAGDDTRAESKIFEQYAQRMKQKIVSTLFE